MKTMNKYRGLPFWCWNGKLDKDEVIRQVHILKEMGFGGFFMHSRTGLATEYLGEDWFDLIRTATEEAEKLGMTAWLYDEDRWPSGTAGGEVTKKLEYQFKFPNTTEPPFPKRAYISRRSWAVLRSDSIKTTNFAIIIPSKRANSPKQAMS